MSEAILGNGHLERPTKEVAWAALTFSSEKQTISLGRGRPHKNSSTKPTKVLPKVTGVQQE